MPSTAAAQCAPFPAGSTLESRGPTSLSMRQGLQIMGQDSFIPVATDARLRNDLVERGFSRQPLRVDVDVARTLEELSHAAWSIPKDKYYDGGDRYRSLNRLRAEIVEGGVKVWFSEESAPDVQLKQ